MPAAFYLVKIKMFDSKVHIDVLVEYTLPAAETWARSHGATDVEIETARHCLGSSVQSARFVATGLGTEERFNPRAFGYSGAGRMASLRPAVT
jgi:hypothetical protein